MVSMIVLITMNGNNHIHLKKHSPFVNDGFDMNTNYNVQAKWVSTVVLTAMNGNNHIHLKQVLTFCA